MKCDKCGKFRKAADCYFHIDECAEEWVECYECCSAILKGHIKERNNQPVVKCLKKEETKL